MHGKKHVFEGLQCLPLYTETPISSLGLGNSLAHYRDEILLTNVCNCISILLSFLKQLFQLGVYMQVTQWFRNACSSGPAICKDLDSCPTYDQ